MDNHSAHRSIVVCNFLRAKGCKLLFLSTQTSEFNPIEFGWSIVKRQWRDCLTHTPLETQDVEWMQMTLEGICKGLSSELLGSVGRAHWKEAMKFLEGVIRERT